MNPELEAYQNEFIEAIPGFISIIDLTLRYLVVNKKLAELMNLDPTFRTSKSSIQKLHLRVMKN